MFHVLRQVLSLRKEDNSNSEFGCRLPRACGCYVNIVSILKFDAFGSSDATTRVEFVMCCKRRIQGASKGKENYDDDEDGIAKSCMTNVHCS